MILVICGGIFLFLIFICIVLGDNKKDDREPYLRNFEGMAYALRVSGPTDNVPNHEEIIHDSTPHQNPVVHQDVVSKTMFWIFPYQELYETRWYPLTMAEVTGINFRQLQSRINKARSKGKDISIVQMSPQIEQEANIRENQTQRAKGVNRTMFDNRGRIK